MATHRHQSSSSAPRAIIVMLVCAVLLCLPAARAMQANTSLTQEEMIARIDAAVHARTTGIASYSVQELYSIYRNGETAPSAQVTVKTVYTRGSGKEYTPIAQTGSSLLRSVIIDKVLANEKEMALAANRESVAVTSANYIMELQPGTVDCNGHTCIVMKLKARRKTSHLFNGKGTFDTSDFTLVHLEGAPAQSPSFLAGETAGRRDYGKIEGFSMAEHAEMHSHSFLLGDTVMKIDYTGYQIQLDHPGAAADQHAAPQASAPAPQSSQR